MSRSITTSTLRQMLMAGGAGVRGTVARAAPLYPGDTMRETIMLGEHVTLHVADHRIDEAWAGTVIGENSVPDDQDRWMELTLYRLDPDSDGHYLAWRNGRSVIYHTGTTACRTVSARKPGRLASVGDLPDHAEPCRECNPAWPDELLDTEKIRYEFDRNTIDRTDTAAAMVEVLTRFRNRRTGAWVTVVSEPVAEVLVQAQVNDPGFADVTLPRQGTRPATRAAAG